MLENALKQRNITCARAVGVKSAVSAALIAASVLLPQLVHALYGAAGGAKFLPMYIPVLLGGVLLGRVWGVCVAVASPVVSYLVTLSLGNPMPAAARLPYMIVELAVFALVSGAFSGAIYGDLRKAFPVCALAAVCGRAVYVLMNIKNLSAALAVVRGGIPGLVILAAAVPLAAVIIGKAIKRGAGND